jgi:2-polyprenyl-3-methyl-5-hydroxy-6-metoxy-1,4-benzoquinol methylase
LLTRTEWISCNACGADDVRELGAVGEWRINTCKRCSLVYVNPIPFFAPSSEFSKMSLDFQYTRFQHSVTGKVLRHDEAQFRRQAALAARFSGRADRPGRFLDYGCGSGATVHVASQMGWDAMGIDLDPALVEIGKRELRANLRCGTLPDATLPDAHVDFVRLRDVIEHLPNPLEILTEIARLLVPGGAVMIATPNEASLPTRARAALGVKKELVATVSPPHHLHGFTPRTLDLVLRRAGLVPVKVETTTPIDPLYVTARNVGEAGWNVHTLAWHVGKLVGMGSMLVCWAVKPASGAAAGAARAIA